MTSVCSSPMEGKVVVVFGASGQDGPYVADACRKRGASAVHGFSRSTASPCDVGDIEQVRRVFEACRPDLVFHLAAESRTAHEALFDNHAAIATGTVNILETALALVPHAKILLAGSGLQFRNDGRPIREDMPFQANSPYAAARIYANYLARYYRTFKGLSTYVAYLFHHESPARSARHTSKMIALAAARAARGTPDRLQLGDISVEKEWAFASDIAEGMVHLILQNSVAECVIGTGKSHAIRDWLDACFSHVGLDWRDYTVAREGFVAEYPRLVSDPATILGLGWRPQTDFVALAALMVDAAIEELNGTMAKTS